MIADGSARDLHKRCSDLQRTLSAALLRLQCHPLLDALQPRQALAQPLMILIISLQEFFVPEMLNLGGSLVLELAQHAARNPTIVTIAFASALPEQSK